MGGLLVTAVFFWNLLKVNIFERSLRGRFSGYYLSLVAYFIPCPRVGGRYGLNITNVSTSRCPIQSLKGDLHGTILSHTTSSRQAYDMNCFL